MRRLLVLLVVVLVNLPALHAAWTDRQITRYGREVQARVLESRTLHGRHLVDYRLPGDVDPTGRTFSASVDDAAYARVRSTDLLAVRVIPDRPGANRPDGEVTSPVLVVAAVAADLIILVVAALWWRRRRGGPGGGAADGPAAEDWLA